MCPMRRYMQDIHLYRLCAKSMSVRCMLLIDPWPMPHLMGHELPLRGGLFLRIGSLLESQNMLGKKGWKKKKKTTRSNRSKRPQTPGQRECQFHAFQNRAEATAESSTSCTQAHCFAPMELLLMSHVGYKPDRFGRELMGNYVFTRTAL